MIGFRYIITGIPEVRRDLAKIRLDAIQSEVAQILDEMAAEAGTYPAPPADSTYNRTNALHDGWLDSEPVFQLDQDSFLATLTNPVPHGGYVQGAEDQAEIHAGRWKTTSQIMDEWEGRAADRIEDALIQKVGM